MITKEEYGVICDIVYRLSPVGTPVRQPEEWTDEECLIYRRWISGEQVEERKMEIAKEEYARMITRIGTLRRENDKLRKALFEESEVNMEESIMRAGDNEQPSVKIDNKYGVNGRGRVYNLQSGREIPEDEPLFLFRGKDRHLPDVLLEYAERCADEDHHLTVLRTKREVEKWQGENLSDVKEPDTDVSDYGECSEEMAAQGVVKGLKSPDRQFNPADVPPADIGGFGARMAEDDQAPERELSVEVIGPRRTDNYRFVEEVSVTKSGGLLVTHTSGATTLYNESKWETCLKWYGENRK